METKNLTPIQQKLVDDLIKEFTKINPKPSANGAKRFTFDSIADCQREKERFLATIKKHNQTMVKVFEKQIADETKAFIKEFGKAFTLQMGYTSGTQTYHNLASFIHENKNGNPQNNYNHKEVYLFIVSKTKNYNYDSRFNYCNGKTYHKLYIDFKREMVRLTLESGEVVSAWKLCGLEFRSNEYLYADKESCVKAPTFDEFIQLSKDTQRRLVEMAS